VDLRYAVKQEGGPLPANKEGRLSSVMEGTKYDAEMRSLSMIEIEQRLPILLREEINAGDMLSARMALLPIRIRARRREVEKIVTALSNPRAIGKERHALIDKSLTDSGVTKKFVSEVETELKAVYKEVADLPPSKPRRQRLIRRCSDIKDELIQFLAVLDKVDSELVKPAR